MSPNPLKEDAHPQEVQQGEGITNLKTQKSLTVIMPDGTVRTFITTENFSGMGQNGQVTNAETTYVVFDPAGNPMPMDPQKLMLSHSGCFISSPEQRATCTSIFHRGLNRNISIGQDGYVLANGAGICSSCQSVRTTIFIVLAILGFGIFWGVLRALWGAI
jgi:hypothetical protein